MKRWKRVLSMTLAFVLMTGLCACKGKNNEDGSAGNKKGGNVNSELAKQYVYRLDEFDFSSFQEQGDETYIHSAVEADGRIYLIMQIYGSKKGSEGYEYNLVSTDLEGKDIKVCKLQTSMDGDVPEGTDEPAGIVGRPRASVMKVSSVAASVDVPADDVDDVGEGEEPEEETNIYENTNYDSFQLAGGDRLYGIKNYYYEDYSDPDNYVSRNERYLCCWDLEGNMLWETALDILSQEDKWFYINSIVGLENGTAMLLINGDGIGKITVDKDGNVSEMQPLNDKLAEYFENSGGCITMPDNQILITYYGEDWNDMYVVTYDIKSDSLNESFQLPSSIAYNGMGNINVDKNGDLLYSNTQGLFKYHIGDTEPQQMMSFVNSDLYINNLSNVLPVDEEHFVGIYSEYDEENYNNVVRGGLFTKVNPEDIPDKTVLVLGGSYIPSDMRKRVVEYNKTSSTHRIVLRDYSQYNSYDDYMAGYNQMNNDIISGKMPDILIVDSYGMSLENYISKGLLADIDALIAKDEELSGIEFVQNVFEACRVDGKLYEIVPSFNVRTYIGKTSIVGDRSGWTFDEAKQLLASMPEGTSLFGDMTRESFFSTAMQMCGSDFIDVSTGKCNFNSDEFIALMEFAKTLPEKMEEDYYEGDWYTAYESQYRENRTILSGCYISSMENMVYSINGSFGEDVTYVGFPNEGGQGSVIATNTSYAIAAGSADLDAAWEFMRYYLTDEYQNTLEWQLPVNRKRFDELAEKATKKPTYEDENGVEVEDNYTYWINDEELILDPLTAEQLDRLKSFVTSVTKRAYYNEDVMNIITEEMDAFYQGQKGAKDVAGIIQSRAQLFVNENR